MSLDDYDGADDGYGCEPDEWEEAMSNCCGHFDRDGVFTCGAAGSEDCDFECPFSNDLGLTDQQIEERDVEEAFAAVRAEREAKGNAEYDSWRIDGDKSE